MMDTTKPKKISAIIGVGKMAEANLRDMLHSSLTGLQGNPKIFSKTPIDLNVYAADIAAFEAAIPAALDGSKTATALKNKLKHIAIKDYIQLAHYAEAVADNDLATFLLSGFQPKTTTRTAAGPLPVPAIDYVVPGANTGEMKFKMKRLPPAISGDVRYGQVPPGRRYAGNVD
jgi:hypothetical protein